MKLTPGEIYFIGEREPKTGATTPYFKIGIVRADENRTSDDRLREHQTGNPRPLFLHKVIKCDLVERVETLMHGLQAQNRVGGSEWFQFDDLLLQETIRITESFAEQTSTFAPIFAQAEALKSEVASDVVLPATDELRDLHTNLLVAEASVKLFDAVKRDISAAMREAIERGEKVGGAARVARVSYAEKFDQDRFREEYPEIFEQFLKITTTEARRWSVTRPRTNAEVERRLSDKLLPVIDEIRIQIECAQAGEINKSDLNAQVLIINENQATVKWESELYLAQLKVAVGTNAGIEGICKWGMTSTTRRTFQEPAFKEQHFELYKDFLILVQQGGQIILNPGQVAAEEDEGEDGDE